MILEGLLETHNWYFSYNVVSLNAGIVDITDSYDGADLGFKYKYRFSAGDAIEIIELDPRLNYNFQGIREGLRFGYAVERDDLIDVYSSGRDNSHLLVNQVLHSDKQIKQIGYKRVVTPSLMTPLFRLYLTWSLAEVFASTKDSQDSNSYYKLKKKAESACLKAVSQNLKPPIDPQLLSIYNWISTYLKQTYSRY